MVEQAGHDPATTRLWAEGSNQLSYCSLHKAKEIIAFCYLKINFLSLIELNITTDKGDIAIKISFDKR